MRAADPVGWLGAELDLDRRRFAGIDLGLARRIADELAQLRQRIDTLSGNAAQDERTRAVTHRAGRAAIEREVWRAHREGHTLGIAFLTLVTPDGAADGTDELLVDLVELLHQGLRGYDHVIRWSEQEFVCVLPGSDLRGVSRIMDQIAIEFARQTLTCFTCGVALLQPDDTPDSLVERAEQAVAAAQAFGEPPGAGESVDQRTSILLVEDDVAIRDMYRLALMQAGYRTAVAGDGRQALRRAKVLRPDLILLDVGIPDLNGEEVLRRLHADPRLATIPIVVVSNRADDGMLIDRLRALGALGCVVKSQLTPAMLVREIPAWLAVRARAAG